MCEVAASETVRNEQLDRLAQQGAAAVPEQPLGLPVHQRDPTAAVDEHDGVGRGVE
jgi:hypothetical protein